MFINLTGPPTAQNPELRRAVNLHLSNIAKAKRPPRFDVQRLDRKEAQQKRRRREADEKRVKDEQFFQSYIRALYDRDIRNSFLVPNDLVLPAGDIDDTDGIIACRDFFQFSLPYEVAALGLSQVAADVYARILLSWAFQYGGMVLYGLAVYRLCVLPESQIENSPLRKRIEHLRSRLIERINERLQEGSVDDILIQAIILAVTIDDYLDYAEFSETHLKGLESVVKHRGGFEVIGSSEAGMADNLRQSLLMSVGAAKLKVRTTLDAAPMTSDHKAVRYDFSTASEKAASNLPEGFKDLAKRGYLSSEMVSILLDFAGWLATLRAADADNVRAWRFPVPAGLSNLEKCIFVTLMCLADDMTAMGNHVSILLWRKPAQRAQMVLKEPGVLRDHHLVNCFVWLATIICTPRKVEIVPHNALYHIQQRILWQAPHLRSQAAIEAALSEFFFPVTRKDALLNSWNDQLD